MGEGGGGRVLRGPRGPRRPREGLRGGWRRVGRGRGRGGGRGVLDVLCAATGRRRGMRYLAAFARVQVVATRWHHSFVLNSERTRVLARVRSQVHLCECSQG